ncbi:hypothetical protein D3C80_1575170 [compost metagenome]
MLGDCMIIKVGKGKYVANLFGQHGYGREKGVIYTDYDALRKSIQALKDNAKYHKLSIALPYGIGCGLGGGDWGNILYPMLEDIFSDYELTLYKLN